MVSQFQRLIETRPAGGFQIRLVLPLGQRRTRSKSLFHQFVEHFVGYAGRQRINRLHPKNRSNFFRLDNIIGVAHLPLAVKTFQLAADDSFCACRQIFLNRVGIGLEKNKRNVIGSVAAPHLIRLLAGLRRNMFDNPDFQRADNVRAGVNQFRGVSPVNQRRRQVPD